MPATKPEVPAVPGWFTTGDRPALIGSRCTACGSVAFPPRPGRCPNPACAGTETEPKELARTGTVWSYTDAQYQPPPPYVAPADPYRPFALAAVELDGEGMVVLGQLAAGLGVEDIEVGTPVELVVEALLEKEDEVQMVWKWRPAAGGQNGG